MPTSTSSPYLDAWKDYEPEVRITRKNTATGALEPATGLTGEFRVADEEQGDAIGALTGITVTERSGTPGTYFAVVQLATLTSELPDDEYPHGTAVFLQFFKAGDVECESFRKIIRRAKYGA